MGSYAILSVCVYLHLCKGPFALVQPYKVTLCTKGCLVHHQIAIHAVNDQKYQQRSRNPTNQIGHKGASIISYGCKNPNNVRIWVGGWFMAKWVFRFKNPWFQKHVFDHCNLNKIFLLKYIVSLVRNYTVMWWLEYPIWVLYITCFKTNRFSIANVQIFGWVGGSPQIRTLFRFLNL